MVRRRFYLGGGGEGDLPWGVNQNKMAVVELRSAWYSVFLPDKVGGSVSVSGVCEGIRVRCAAT